MKGSGPIMRNILIATTVIIFATLVLQLPTWAKGKPPWASEQKLTVMTQNLYVGAEIQSIAGATDIIEFIAGVQAALMQIAYNNFSERAVALAAEIVEKNPHLVGLQEVYDLTINGENDLPPYRNYLNDLLQALEDQGASYYVAAVVKNLDLTIEYPGFPTIGVVDRDVILAREDIEAVPLTLCASPSLDGCNYEFVAFKNTPVGTIYFERGYVGVTTPYGLFLNTHLEIRDPDPTNPYSPFVQRFQAIELMAVLNALSGYPGPIIVVGDINSSPEDDVIFLEGNPIFPPYMQFGMEGYTDVWGLRPGKPKGFTCCYEEDLSMPADLYERIDMIFTNKLPERVKANVVGNDEADQTYSGLWPSDHAGVAARIWY